MTLAWYFPLIILTLNREAKANQSWALQMVNLAKKLFKILSPLPTLSSLHAPQNALLSRFRGGKSVPAGRKSVSISRSQFPGEGAAAR